jgi:hypothetical protein
MYEEEIHDEIDEIENIDISIKTKKVNLHGYQFLAGGGGDLSPRISADAIAALEKSDSAEWGGGEGGGGAEATPAAEDRPKPLPEKLSNIDNLTISCFMNKKNKYKKAIAVLNLAELGVEEKTPDKYFLYKDKIMEYTHKLLYDGFSAAHNSNIQDSFKEYINHLIDHFEYEEKLSLDKDNLVRREKYQYDWEERPVSEFWSKKFHKK